MIWNDYILIFYTFYMHILRYQLLSLTTFLDVKILGQRLLTQSRQLSCFDFKYIETHPRLTAKIKTRTLLGVCTKILTYALKNGGQTLHGVKHHPIIYTYISKKQSLKLKIYQLHHKVQEHQVKPPSQSMAGFFFFLFFTNPPGFFGFYVFQGGFIGFFKF